MKFRTGKWVVWNDRVGVIIRVQDNLVDIHLVDEQGLTIEVIRSDIKFLRLAELHEIPCARTNSPPTIQKASLWHSFSRMAAKILR